MSCLNMCKLKKTIGIDNQLQLLLLYCIYFYPDLHKEKQYSKNCGLTVKKVKKSTKAHHTKTIIELKGRAKTFHKCIITFWAKADQQPKKKKVCSCHSQWTLEITSALLCLNRFYYRANLNLIPSNLLNIVNEIWRNP